MKTKRRVVIIYDFFVQVQQVTVKILSLEGKRWVGQIILFFLAVLIDVIKSFRITPQSCKREVASFSDTMFAILEISSQYSVSKHSFKELCSLATKSALPWA